VTFRVQVAGGEGFDRLAADLRRAGGQLRPRLTERLRKPTKAIYQEVERGILHGDLSGVRTRSPHRFTAHIPSLGVRRPTARALRWKVSTSSAGPTAQVTFTPGDVPERIRALVPYWLGQKTRLRHPIMGKTRGGKWRGGAGQHIPNAWEAQKAAGQALDDIADIIAGRK
jgi:hypothetical protein